MPLATKFNFYAIVVPQKAAPDDIASLSRYISVTVPFENTTNWSPEQPANLPLIGNVIGTPEIKFGAGPWQPMTLASGPGGSQTYFKKQSSIPAGSVVDVFYRDSRGERKLFTAHITPSGSRCTPTIDYSLQLVNSGVYLMPVLNPDEYDATTDIAFSLIGAAPFPFNTNVTGSVFSTIKALNAEMPAGNLDVSLRVNGSCVSDTYEDVLVQNFELNLTYVKNDVSYNTGANGSINLNVQGGTAPYSYLWNDGATTEDRTGLSAGTYSVTVTDAGGLTKSISVQINQPPPISVSYTKTNVTANGQTDGTITLTVSGGSGSYLYQWADGPTTQNRAGLPPATYHVDVFDALGGPSVGVDIEITQPAPPSVEGTFVSFPELNSLRWVVRNPIIDGCLNMETLDNTLFCERERMPGQVPSNYNQLQAYCDARPVQFWSDFRAFRVAMHDAFSEEVVKTFEFETKIDNINSYVDYGVLIRHNPDTAGTSRVYFTTLGAFPIPVKPGDLLEILNNLDGFNGTYEIVAVNIDGGGQYYMVINKTYSIPGPVSSATGRFRPNTQKYNVYEAEINYDGVEPGLYYLSVYGLHNDGSLSLVGGETENIDLKQQHRNTKVIDYKNRDNFSINWQTGITGRVRIKADIDEQPTSEISSSRNANGDPVNVSANPSLKLDMHYYALPGYMHRKLTLIFSCDAKSINGMAVGNAEVPGELKYSKDKLADNTAKVEFLNWIGKYNSDDITSVGDGAFVTQINKFYIEQL